METSPLTCKGNQWKGFYMIEVSVLNEVIYVETETLTKLVPLELKKNLEVCNIWNLNMSDFLTI